MAKPNIDENKLKALESAMAQIERNYGKGAVMKLGDNVGMNVDVISTGILMWKLYRQVPFHLT